MHTYYHQQNGRPLIIISEEKVPELKLALNEYEFKIALKVWLSKSKTYEVYPGEEGKFIQCLEKIYSKSPYNFEDYMVIKALEGYLLIPNEMVKINLVYKFNEGFYSNFCSVCRCQFTGAKRQPVCKTCCDKEYAFFNQPTEEKKTEIVELTDNYIRAVSNYVSELASKLEELKKEIIAKLDSSVEEKDLWQSSEDAAYKEWKELDLPYKSSFGIQFAEYYLTHLKQKYNLIPKEK